MKISLRSFSPKLRTVKSEKMKNSKSKTTNSVKFSKIRIILERTPDSLNFLTFFPQVSRFGFPPTGEPDAAESAHANNFLLSIYRFYDTML